MQMKTLLLSRSFSMGVLALGLCVVLSGCSGKKQRTGLSGKVMKGDTPITGGYRIKLTSIDGKQTFEGPIQEDGRYEITDIPFEGEVTISLYALPKPMSYTGKDASKSSTKAPANIPTMTQVPVDKKYLDPKTSPIKVTIEKDKKVEKDIEVN
jgi:hypothetical protein